MKFTIGSFFVAMLVLVAGMPSSAAQYNEPTKEQLSACAEFPKLLKSIIGDGDLRDTGRISQIIGSDITLEPRFYPKGDQKEKKVTGLDVVINTDKMFFKGPSFQFWYLIGNTDLNWPYSPNAISIMTFTFSWPITCVKKADIVSYFGKMDESFWVPPATSNFRIRLGNGPHFETTLYASALYNSDYAYTLVIVQSSTGLSEK